MKLIEKNPTLKREIIDYVLIILAIILIRVFLFTPIKVEQNSMQPTLHPKDVMILNKIGIKLDGIKRFDIVVLHFKDEHLVKRVIGLPGEHIEYSENKLYINGEYIEENFIDTTTNDFELEDISYDVIPEDKYFVLGDNRNNSTDSRVFGLIDKEDIMGKTNLIIFPFKNIKLLK